MAASVSSQDATEDIICPNMQQNIIVVSTPHSSNAERYRRLASFKLDKHQFEVRAYETAPDYTVKGVVRGIPLDEDAKAIHLNIVNKRNPTALAAKRLSSTTSVIIAFDGGRVPTADVSALAWTYARIPKTVCVEAAELRTQTPITSARRRVASAGEPIPLRTRPARLGSRPLISSKNDAGIDAGPQRRPPSSCSSRTTTKSSHLLPVQAPALEAGRGERGLDSASRASLEAGPGAELPGRVMVVRVRGVRSKTVTWTRTYLTG
ncbi:hypothetical protein MTO96_034987 [Rhipicephalus appendiculatus]